MAKHAVVWEIHMQNLFNDFLENKQNSPLAYESKPMCLGTGKDKKICWTKTHQTSSMVIPE